MSNDVVINVKADTQGFNLDTVNRSITSVGANARATSEQMVQGFDRARDAAGRFAKTSEKLSRDAAGRLRDSSGRFVRGGGGGGGGLGDAAGDAAGRVANTVGAALSNAFTTAAQSAMRLWESLSQVTSAAGPAGQAIGAVVQILIIGAAVASAAGAAFVALAPALLAVGGAAAAAAGALVGLGVAFGAVKIGFGGIGDALAAHGKSMGGAGGAASNMAEQEHQAAMRVRAATRALVDAKRAEREAIADLNRAREREIERLKDLDAQIRGGAISEKEAALELQEARLAVQNMDAGASEEDKERMRLRLERAQLEYDETVRRNKGLAEERKKADKVGVEGSDQVQAALQRQAQAHEQVVRAQEALAEAQRKTAVASGGAAGGINAFDEAMKKLSPNAQALVRTLIGLSARWDEVKKRVQDRLLAGFAEDVQSLAGKWLPVLDDVLGRMADRLNVIGRSIGRTLGSPEFIANFRKAADVGGEFISRVGGGIPALLDGFMRLAAASGPVLDVIGKAIRGIAEWFDKWITSAEKSGALRSFMERAAVTLDKIFTIGKLAFQVVGEFISIIFPSSEKTANSVFDSMIKQLEAVKKFLQDPANREAIKNIADKVGEFIAWLVSTGIPAFMDFSTAGAQAAFMIIREFTRIKTFFEIMILSMRKMWNLFLLFMVNRMLDVVNVLDATLGRIVPGLSSKLAGARAGLNKFKNDTNKTLGEIQDRAITIKIRQVFEVVGQTVASVANQLVNIGAVKPRGKATGGISGGGLEWVGEHGPELRNLAPGSRVYSNPDSMRMAAGAGMRGSETTVRLVVGRGAEHGVIAEILRLLRAEIGDNYGGDVQLALGR